MAVLRVWAAVLAAALLGATVHACNDCYPSGGSLSPWIRPAYPVAAPCPCTPEPQIRYACPTPAPTSPGPTVLSTNEPPVYQPGFQPGKQPQKGPTIYQNRTFSGVPQITEARTPQCKVSFWNLSGVDVTLSIGERTHTIAKDRAVILDLDRHFTWRTNFHNPKAEEVPDDMNHFEVLVR